MKIGLVVDFHLALLTERVKEILPVNPTVLVRLRENSLQNISTNTYRVFVSFVRIVAVKSHTLLMDVHDFISALSAFIL